MKTFEKSLAAIAAALLAALAGCESESSSSASVSVSPGFSRVPAGQSVTLSASGGDGYGWSLSNPSYGRLSASTGSSVVYTSAKNGVTQVVTLKATLGSSAFQCQATIAQGDAAYASTVSPSGNSSTSQGETQGQTPDEQEATLAITPSSTTVGSGARQRFTASGGAGSYSWSLSNPSYGRLSATTGSSVVYTPSSAYPSATQTITVRATVNGLSRSATATVRHGEYSEGNEIGGE
ncbi:MAG: hypothetical protein IKH04_03715 [Kiritimatiellae bacterium]|nr:hypothetical protein [Kiritimatiellia bacterium]